MTRRHGWKRSGHLQTWTVRAIAGAAIAIVACSGTSEGTNSSSPSKSGPSCDLKEGKYYSSCSEGCGDVMSCNTFCRSCDFKCYVSCVTNDDCSRVGAGSCETSTTGTSRCSKAPSKCPGDSTSSNSGGSSSGPSCPTSPTYGKSGGDFGAPCSRASDCASPLTCAHGFCNVESCTKSAECQGRTYAGDCVGANGQRWTCSGGTCRSGCNSPSHCKALNAKGWCPGGGSIARDHNLSIGVCYFGSCNISGYCDADH